MLLKVAFRYTALGDRAGLARQYQALKEVLSSEMGMEPLATMAKFYQRLIDSMKS